MSSLPASFWERLPHRTDGELADALMHPEHYEPEALAAIRAEWEKRKIPLATTTSIINEQVRQDEEIERRARKLWTKTEFFGLYLSGVFFGTYPLRRWLDCKAEGYRRKANHCLLAMGLVILTWVLLFVICSILLP